MIFLLNNGLGHIYQGQSFDDFTGLKFTGSIAFTAIALLYYAPWSDVYDPFFILCSYQYR